VFDPLRNLLYASVNPNSATNANYVVSIEPNTGSVTPLFLAGNMPGVLALSHDFKFLYVGVDGASSVVRFNLQTGSIDETISLGSDPLYGAFGVEDLAVSPMLLSRSLYRGQSSREGTLAEYSCMTELFPGRK